MLFADAEFWRSVISSTTLLLNALKRSAFNVTLRPPPNLTPLSTCRSRCSCREQLEPV